MLTALLLTTLTLAPTEAIPRAQEPPVKVWLNKGGDIKRGTRVKVYTRVETDGYLLILHAEADGRIRVLFPLDPFHDNYVRGSQDFEVRGRGDREAFQIYTASGVGTVYAAFSRDPFQFGEFVRNDHWDYRLFETWRLNEGLDAEAELTALVHQMAGDASRFDYDLTHYAVAEQTASSGGGGTVYVGAGYGYGYGYPYHGYGWGGGPYFGIGWGWGGFGFNIGWSWGWGYPYYGYGYYPYSWYRPYYWPHHYAYYPYYGCCYYRGPYYHAAGYPYYGGGYYGNSYYNYGVGAYVLPRYTFKGSNRGGLANGGITTWQRGRRATTSGQFASYSRYVGTASRRAAPSTVQSGARRTSTQTAGRRVAPTTGAAGTGRASTTGRPSIERRSVSTSNTTGRQVQPDGWGMTDGRRTVRIPDRTPKPGATQNTDRRVQPPPNLQPRTPEGERATRTVQPRSGTEGASGRSVSQRRQTGSGSTAAPGTGGKSGTRQTLQQRDVSPRRPTAQPATQSKNSLRSTLRQITNPQRTAPRAGAAPSRASPGRPTLERRVSPTRSVPRPNPPQTRSQPPRSPSQPQMRAPSRPATSRPQVRSSPPRPRAAPSRPSAPRARPRRP
jgi:hypothetical protein